MVLLSLAEEEEEPGGLVLSHKQEMVLLGREGWVGQGPEEPIAPYSSPSREAWAGKTRREHADKLGNPDSQHRNQPPREGLPVSELERAWEALGTMWPDTSFQGPGLWVPEIECKLSGSVASAFTRGDISPACFPGWDAVNRAVMNIQVCLCTNSILHCF